MARSDLPRLAILGAGPIGLEAAIYAASLKMPVTVYERQRVGTHLEQWGHVRLFSPFGLNRTPLGLATIKAENPQHTFPAEDACITGREHLRAYLEPLAQTGPLREVVQTGVEVLAIGRRNLLKGDGPGDARRGRHAFLLLVRDAQKRERTEEADIVLDCTGTYGQHRWLGEGGIPARGERELAARIGYALEDVLGERRNFYAGKTTLVVGAGYSAATTVCNLAALAEDDSATWVIWVARGSSIQPIKRVVNDPLPERDRLAMRANTLATRAEGNVEFHNQTVIECIEPLEGVEGFKVHARSGNKPATWEVERIVANVGYTPHPELYRELQVHECYASLGPMNLAAALLKQKGSDCLTIGSQGANTLRNPEPNFYILGAKSYGRNSHFLLRTGFEQIREVFTLITGKEDLNLYKP